MVKPPKIRHSKVRKDPVTIDLDPADVKREQDAAKEFAAKDARPAAETEQPVKPNAADEALADAEADSSSPETPVGEATRSEAAAGDESVLYGRAARPDAQAGRRGMLALAAGVVGALIALAGAAALQWAGALPAPRSESAALDSASLHVLRGEIETLKQQAAAETGDPDPALVQSLGESTSRIDALSTTIEQLQAELAAVQSEAGAPADASALQALEARLAEVEASADAGGENSAALDGVNQQMTELSDSVRSATDGTAAQAGRLDALEQRVAEMAERVEAQTAEPGMAMAVAATSLKSAIDRGAPFMMELETYAAIAPEMPQIAALRDLAASGVPTRTEIEAETADAAGRMIAASTPANSNASFIERMFTSAQSLVEVRPVGSIEGDSAGAIVARMEVALNQGDYEKAVEEFETLSEPAQVAGREFIGKVQARAAADRLVAEALAGALKTPGGEG